jgi:hypothetical protein
MDKALAICVALKIQRNASNWMERHNASVLSPRAPASACDLPFALLFRNHPACAHPSVAAFGLCHGRGETRDVVGDGIALELRSMPARCCQSRIRKNTDGDGSEDQQIARDAG